MKNQILSDKFSPLAARMRFQALNEVVGQAHLIQAGKWLYQVVKMQKLHSIIFELIVVLKLRSKKNWIS